MRLKSIYVFVIASLLFVMVLCACGKPTQLDEAVTEDVTLEALDITVDTTEGKEEKAQEISVEEEVVVEEVTVIPPTQTIAPTSTPLPNPTETKPPATHQIYEIGEEIWDLAVVDLNGDAYPDIAAADAGSNVTRLLFNNGDGTFAETALLDTGKLPYGLAAADLDGNSQVDLIIGHDGFDDQVGKLSVLLNNGDGTFKPSGEYATGYNSGWVNTADLDGDTDADVFVELSTEPLPISDEGKVGVGVWLNNGDGSFQEGQNYFINGERIGNAAVGYFNSDAFPDLAIRHYPDPKVSVLLNEGDGSFGEAVDYEVNWGPHWVTTADLNNDSAVDIVVATSRGIVSMLLNDGDGRFQEKVDIETGGEPYYVDSVDMDGDMLLDLLVAPTGSGIVSVFLNKGTGNFELNENYYFPGVWAYIFKITDVDLDGNRDLVTSSLGSSVFVFPLEIDE